MKESDISFLITDSLTDRSVPKIEIRDEKTLIVITKTARDDYKIIGDYGLTDLDFQRFTYEEDVDRIIFEGGLYVLKLHTELQLRSNYISVVADLLKYIRDKNVWFATIPQLINWWEKKGGIEVRYETRGDRRVSIEVSNPREKDTKDFVVQINLNKKVKNIRISSEIINTTIPRHNYDDGNQILYLHIKLLPAGETITYFIDFENEINFKAI